MRPYQQIFRKADEGQKGFLDCYDLKVAVMMAFGQKISQWQAVQLLVKYGSKQESGDLGLSQVHFEKMSIEYFIVDKDEEIRSAFLLFDKTCRGFLSLEDVRWAFHQVCPHLNDHRIDYVFRELDSDGDRRVSYKDFDLMMKLDNFS